MKRKAILYNSFSNKFNYFKYSPVRYSGNIERDIESVTVYTEALDECRNINRDFCNEVISYIDILKGKIDEDENLNYEYIIRNAINELIDKKLQKRRIAICGGGEHTKQLIKYFGNELNIVLITGREVLSEYQFDYPFYEESKLVNCEFDCVLLSSFKYRHQMMEELRRNDVNEEIIDIYECIEGKGIKLKKIFINIFQDYG